MYPFCKEKDKYNGMSMGLSEAGYDILSDKKVILYPITFKNLFLSSIGFDRSNFRLTSSYERFVIPDYLMMMIVDKSSWARRGLAVQNTVAEPGWEGFLTLELTNHSTETIVIEKYTPIAQVIFIKLDQPTDRPYSGKYQNQARGPQKAILD